MAFDPDHVPFSRRGSYLACSLNADGDDRRFFVRNVRGDVPHDRVFRLDLGGAPYAIEAAPARMELSSAAGDVDVSFEAPSLLRFEGDCPITLSTYVPSEADPYQRPYVVRTGEAACRVNAYSHLSKYRLTAREGDLTIEAPWNGQDSPHVSVTATPDSNGTVTLTLEEYRDEPRWIDSDATPDVAPPGAAFERWLAGIPSVPQEFADTRRLAGYILWASTVAAERRLDREAVYMSKNWMTSVWSWDHCFNALALADGHPELAWDQFALPFDFQTETGALPDSVNDAVVERNFVKPPIHGLTLRLLRERSDAVGRGKLAAIYEPLTRWTEWWFDHRDHDGDGIPAYHHGNDSGWDNGTTFLVEPPVEAPDLAAFLVLQLEELATVADHLGKAAAADRYGDRASTLLDRLLDHSWTGERFLAPHSGTHETVAAGDSLQSFLPLVLGDRLPADVRERLLAGVAEEGRFLAPHGPATEALSSSHYEQDSYWRGPVWAPSTMLLVEGLAASGEHDLAIDVSRRFCRAVAESGFAENLDPESGEGYRDRAYTWTASVFLVLAHEYLQEGR